MKTRLLLTGLCIAVFLSPASAAITEREPLRALIDTLVSEHGFQRGALLALFDQAELRPSIIEAITRPAEGKAWYEYRPIFLTENRIEGGVDFWNEHADLLAQAEESYGVPPEIITAIVGVETGYGANIGTYRVLDALTTLSLDYPKRSEFFTRELENFLLLSREEGIDPLEPVGSYAGAMGQPQFIPSSYRAYAIDFNRDGRRDLWSDPADIIGSVANYFSEHGWRAGAPVSFSARVKGEDYADLVTKELKPETSLKSLRQAGVAVPRDIPETARGALLEFEQEFGPEYWVGLDNFYVITRYNRSPLYAMAVYQLSQEIRARHDAEPTVAKP